MKKILYVLLIGFVLFSCSDEDSLSSADRNVVSIGNDVKFEELVLLLNIKTSDSTYLVVQSIDSVNIFVNDYFWAKISSQQIDTSNVEKYTLGNKFVTEKKLNYLVIAEQDIEQPNYNTAGDYAQYLNAYYELNPGEYACLIESFQVTYKDNTTEKYYPYQYTSFILEENLESVFVGEVQITINP